MLTSEFSTRNCHLIMNEKYIQHVRNIFQGIPQHFKFKSRHVIDTFHRNSYIFTLSLSPCFFILINKFFIKFLCTHIHTPYMTLRWLHCEVVSFYQNSRYYVLLCGATNSYKCSFKPHHVIREILFYISMKRIVYSIRVISDFSPFCSPFTRV